MPRRALRYAASPLLRVRDGLWVAKKISLIPSRPEGPYRGLIPSSPGLDPGRIEGRTAAAVLSKTDTA